MYLLSGGIKRLVVEWTGTLVEFHHSYDDIDRFDGYSGRLELWLSQYSAVQTRRILQTIRVTRWKGQYYRVSETSTWQLNQSLWILQALVLPFFLFLRNITVKNMEKQLSWRNNKSTIERFEEWSLTWFLALSMHFSTLESLCFVPTVGCGIGILSSVHVRLATSKTFTWTRSSIPIALCAVHQNRRLERGIHHCGDWETIGNTSERWHSWLREMRRRTGKRENIWMIKRLDPQKASSGIWYESPGRLWSYPISFVPSIQVCWSIWWSG